MLGQAFVFLLGCAWLWTVAFILEMVVPTLALKLLFARIQFIGIVTLPIAWLHLSLVHTGGRLHPLLWAIIGSVAATILLFIWVVPMPNPFWGEPSLVLLKGGQFSVDYDYGPLFTRILMPFTHLLILSSLGLLFHLLFQPHVVYKRQTSLIIIGTLIPLVVNILYLFKLTPVTNINFSSATLSITGLLYGYALFKYHYLDWFPVARDVIFEHMSDAVLVLNEQGIIIDANNSARALASDPLNLIGQYYHGVKVLYLEEVDHDGTQDFEVAQDGNPFRIEERLFHVTFGHVNAPRGHGRYTIVLYHDVTEREKLHEQIAEMGRRDPLTGVFNRRELLLHIEQFSKEAFDTHVPLSLLMLDIDGFKRINDTYGHEAGDRALEVFAKTLFRNIQVSDIVGRYGGDEFIIASLGMDEEAARQLAERIRVQVASLVLASRLGNFTLEVSLGAKTYRFSDSQESIDPLSVMLAEVDSALYIAKREGKNRVVHLF